MDGRRIRTRLSQVVAVTSLCALGWTFTGMGTPIAAGATGPTITIPTWWAPKQEMPPTQRIFNTVFTPKTGIHVKLQYVAQNVFAAKILTAAGSGNPYPVISVAASFLPQFEHAGILQPLNKFIQASHFNTGAFLPGVMRQVTHKGKIYALSNDQGGFYLYYNEALFKKAHVPFPNASFTWAQMLKDAIRLTPANHKIWGLDFSDLATGFPDLWPRMNGQFLFNPTVTKIQLTDPATERAFEFAHNLIFKYKVAPPVSSEAVPALTLFAQGDVAMMIGGSWGVDYLRYVKPSFSWNIAPLPAGPAVAKHAIPYPIFNGTYTMSKGISDSAAAWKVLEFYASATFADHIMGRHLSSLPALKSEVTDPKAYDLWPKAQPEGLTESFVRNYLDHAVHIRYYRYFFNDTLNSDLNDLGVIFSVNKSPLPILQHAQNAINSQLKTMPWAH